jgi:aspartate-semialdehyde dehydrogenase
MKSALKVAVLDPTELVGSEIIKILEERNFPLAELILLGNRRTAGEKAECQGREWPIRVLDSLSFKGVDLAFFSCETATTMEHAARAKASGSTIIDFSSRFSLADSVPVGVPEGNPGALKQHQASLHAPGRDGPAGTDALAHPPGGQDKARHCLHVPGSLRQRGRALDG